MSSDGDVGGEVDARPPSTTISGLVASSSNRAMPIRPQSLTKPAAAAAAGSSSSSSSTTTAGRKDSSSRHMVLPTLPSPAPGVDDWEELPPSPSMAVPPMTVIDVAPSPGKGVQPQQPPSAGGKAAGGKGSSSSASTTSSSSSSSKGTTSVVGGGGDGGVVVLEWHVDELVVKTGRRRGGKGGAAMAAEEDEQRYHQQQASASAANGSGGGRRARGVYAGPGKKRLLRGIVGRTRSGEMTAIMGPSGCGKTSLIECLSLRNRDFEGAINLNGKGVGGDYFVQSGLVHQKELLFGYMSVREHLSFQAVTKLGTKTSRQERDARMEEVMKEMGLWECGDTLIGGSDPTFLHKGLSGGERKRLVIATELLQCPAILFLDEPTTGLDSVRAEDVVSALHLLASAKGIVVMSSIHMPSGEVVSYFSHLLLLTADGRVAYHGPMPHALDYFDKLGFSLPEVYSATDFFLRLASKDPLQPTQQECGRLDYLVTAYESSEFMPKLPLPIDSAHKHFHGVRGLKVSVLTLMRLNVWRGFLSNKRDLVSLGLWGIVMAINGFLIGLIFLQQANQQWRSLTGALFIQVVAILLICSLPNVVRFPLEWSIIVREYMCGSNALGPYVASKIIFDIPFLYGPVLLAAILYWMIGLAPDLLSFLRFVGVTVLVEQTAVAVGLLLASFSANPVVGFYLIPCMLLPMVLFSGLLYQRSSVPIYLAWMQELSVVNYGFSSLLALTHMELPPGQRKQLLDFTEIDPQALPDYLSRLVIITVCCYALTYTSLRLRVLSSANTNI